nr:hypothetical protein [Acholeplasmatales bacterium]
MKKKKLFVSALLVALSTAMLVSCGKKNNNNEQETITSVNEPTSTSNNTGVDSTSNNGEASNTSTKSKTTTSKTSVSIPTTSIEIPDIQEASLETIYNDFKKTKLPNTYTKVANKTAYLNAITLQSNLDSISNYDCIEQVGFENVDNTKINYLIDSTTDLSEDESFSGNILGAYVINIKNYVENLRLYEEETYGGYQEEFYSFQQKYILYYLSEDGSNKDIFVLDNKGLV